MLTKHICSSKVESQVVAARTKKRLVAVDTDARTAAHVVLCNAFFMGFVSIKGRFNSEISRGSKRLRRSVLLFSRPFNILKSGSRNTQLKYIVQIISNQIVIQRTMAASCLEPPITNCVFITHE